MTTLIVAFLITGAVAVAQFTYTDVGTRPRTATPLASPLTFPTPFAPHYTKASTLLPADANYTTYSYNPAATQSEDGKYGQSAYNALWAAQNVTFKSALPFTTTVEPTPVAASELVYPPSLPFATHFAKCALPKDFSWGMAGAAWQVEGALQFEGRGPSVPDRSGTRGIPGSSDDGMTNDMSYLMYKQDIARLAAMGVPYYSFSISWSRILPFGVADSPVNQQAILHYDDLINTCLQYGVKPVVTLWHFDTPSAVNPDQDTLVQDFLYYAKVVMSHYADRVPIWFTFNEANIQVGLFFRQYQTLTRAMIAHTEVYRWYKDELKGTGRVSIKFANNLAVPLHGPSNLSDIAAATRYQELTLGIIANPLFLGKQIPEQILNTKGLNLTPLTEVQIARSHGAVDFFAVDPYVAQFASAPEGGIDACVANSSHPEWAHCAVLSNIQPDGWLMGDASYTYVYIAPQYFRQQLKYLWDVYKPTDIMITEFGFPVQNEHLKTAPQARYDLERSLYYTSYLDEMVKAIHLDKVNVTGAFAWTFVDNNAYGDQTKRYGLQTVNYTSGKFERTYKRSFFDFVDFFHRSVK